MDGWMGRNGKINSIPQLEGVGGSQHMYATNLLHHHTQKPKLPRKDWRITHGASGSTAQPILIITDCIAQIAAVDFSQYKVIYLPRCGR